MKHHGWIPIHNQVRYWLPRGKFNELEALVSHTLDINDGKSFSINGYAKLWGWSRCKVRNFLKNLQTGCGHHRDTHLDSYKTGFRQGIVLIINNLQDQKDTVKTGFRQGKRQGLDRVLDTTINPNLNPVNPNPKNPSIVETIIAHLNYSCNTQYRVNNKKTCALIETLLKQGFTEMDFKAVIDNKVSDWLSKPDMVKFLRPETLFGSKFEGYLNQKKAINNKFAGIDAFAKEMEEKIERDRLQAI